MKHCQQKHSCVAGMRPERYIEIVLFIILVSISMSYVITLKVSDVLVTRTCHSPSLLWSLALSHNRIDKAVAMLNTHYKMLVSVEPLAYLRAEISHRDGHI